MRHLLLLSSNNCKLTTEGLTPDTRNLTPNCLTPKARPLKRCVTIPNLHGYLTNFATKNPAFFRRINKLTESPESI